MNKTKNVVKYAPCLTLHIYRLKAGLIYGLHCPRMLDRCPSGWPPDQVCRGRPRWMLDQCQRSPGGPTLSKRAYSNPASASADRTPPPPLPPPGGNYRFFSKLYTGFHVSKVSVRLLYISSISVRCSKKCRDLRKVHIDT